MVRLDRSLIAIDIDGTLIGSNRRISTRVRDAVIKVQARGARVVLATGRQPFSAAPVAAELRASGPHVVADGGLVWDAATDVIEVQQYISARDLAKTTMIASLHGASLVIYRGRSSEAVMSRRDLQYMLSYGDFPPQTIDDYELLSIDGLAHQVIFVSAALGDFFDSLANELRSHLHEYLNIRFATRGYLSCVSHGVSKGATLARVASILGIVCRDIISIGDGENDLDMFDVAGSSVAMSTAPDAVRRAATQVTGSVEEDGVAQYLEALMDTSD